MAGTAVSEVVAVDRSNDHIFQSHRLYRFGQMQRFLRVQRQGLAVGDPIATNASQALKKRAGKHILNS